MKIFQARLMTKKNTAALRFWTAEDWAPYTQAGPKHDISTSEEGVPLYLEEEDGTTFPLPKYLDLRKLVRERSHTLSFHTLAPSTWGNKNVHSTRYMLSEIYKSYPELANCHGHFRAHTLLTCMWSDLKRPRKNGDAIITPEGIAGNNTGNNKRGEASTTEAASTGSKRSNAPGTSRRAAKRTKLTRKRNLSFSLHIC